MEIIVQPTAEDANLIAARILAETVREKPHAVLGFATGATPLRLYEHLARLHREEGLSFRRVTAFNLDEFVGLDPSHPGSFHRYMEEHLLRHLDLPAERLHVPDGRAGNIPLYCRKYEEMIKSTGGIDIQVLGIGRNGHIGFNEPSSSLASRTRIKALTRQTRRGLAELFGGEDNVPAHVITMGLGTILDSRLALLLAFGSHKAEAVAAAAEGPVTASLPASVLQMHPRAVCVLDQEAAVALKHIDYYDWAYRNKPDWQRY